MEEDETPQSSIVLGRIAYAKEIENQLNILVSKRIQTGDDGPLTDAELRAIRAAVEAKARAAIGGDQGIWAVFRNQDDNIGFAYVAFGDGGLKALAESNSRSRPMEFGEIANEGGANRFTLAGTVSIVAVRDDRVDLCASERAAVEAKEREIAGLQTRRDVLQLELQHAAPQNKAAIVAEIAATNDVITLAEQELPDLKAALDACESRWRTRPGGDLHGIVRDGPR